MICTAWMIYVFAWGPGGPDCADLYYSWPDYPCCMSGPGTEACPGCQGRWDWDTDGDVDLQDFAAFQRSDLCLIQPPNPSRACQQAVAPSRDREGVADG